MSITDNEFKQTLPSFAMFEVVFRFRETVADGINRFLCNIGAICLSAHAPCSLFLSSLFPKITYGQHEKPAKLEFVSLKQNGAREIFSMVSRSRIRENCIFPQCIIIS